MKCKFINVLMFAVGAAIGSAVTWKVVKTKYEQIAKEEIESVKEAFADRIANLQEQVDDYVDADAAEEWSDRARQIDWKELEDLDEEEDEDESYDTTDDRAAYARIANNYTSEKGGAVKMAKRPYVISPDDFGELDDYNRITLCYYSDGTLEDEDHELIDESEFDNLIGSDSLFHFGEYEDDSVFVRNEYLKTDFEILKDYRTYAEANSIGPDQVDD